MDKETKIEVKEIKVLLLILVLKVQLTSLEQLELAEELGKTKHALSLLKGESDDS